MNKKVYVFAGVFSLIVAGYIKTASQLSDLQSQLMIAVRSDCKQEVTRLLSQEVPIDFHDNCGRSPLLLASVRGSTDIVKILLDKGASIDFQNQYDGETSLIIASRGGHKDIAQILLDRGANVNFQDHQNITALMRASHLGNEKFIHMLLKAGADIRLCDNNGFTSFHWAAQINEPKVIQIFLAMGLDVNLLINNGSNLLRIAIDNDCKDIIPILLEAGVDINHRDKDGDSPLFSTVSTGGFPPLEYKHEIASMLFRHGAHWPNPENYSQDSEEYGSEEYLQELVADYRDVFDTRGEALAIFFTKLDDFYNVHGDQARLVGLFADLPEEHTPKGSGGNNFSKHLFKRRRVG